MILFRCEHCGSYDLELIRSINPNDKTPIFNHCLDAVESHHRIKCKACGKTGEPLIEVPDADPDAILDVETDQFKQWLDGHADLFVASIGHYRKSDDTLLGGGDHLFYAVWRAVEFLSDYCAENELQPNEENYHMFEIRLFIPSEGKHREDYPNPQSIFDLGNFTAIEPLYKRTI